jgi:hypothetical protein
MKVACVKGTVFSFSASTLLICFSLIAGSPEAHSATEADVTARISNAMQKLQQYKPAPSLDDPHSLTALRSVENTMLTAMDVPTLTVQNFT